MSIVSALRGAVRVYRAERAEAALLAAHRDAVVAHARAEARYSHDHAKWARHRVVLSTVAMEARDYQGIALEMPAYLEPRAGEVLYAHIAEGGLVDLLRDAGAGRAPGVVGAGEIWVTNQRVVYVGQSVREWDFADTETLDHRGPAITMLPSCARRRSTGISYAGPHQEAFRRRLELARASFAGTRHELVAAAEAALQRHVEQEPVGPGPAPAPPALEYSQVA